MYSYFGTNEQTGNFLYKEILNKKEQFLFTNLCQLIIDNNNDVPYGSMSELCIRVGETNRARFNTFIKHCEELNLVKKTTRYYTKYISINPDYYKRFDMVSEDTIKLFRNSVN